MWTAECNEIVFTDLSRFCLQHHNCPIRVWRNRGERMLNSWVMHRHTAPGIMVWGGIGYHSRTPLVRIAGTLNIQRYISEVMEPVVLPYLQADSLSGTFADRKHVVHGCSTIDPDYTPAATPDQHWQRVEAAWSAVPQEHIQSLFESMPWRVATNFVKAMDRNASGFAYLKQKISSISEAKIKEGIFVGPQIRELQKDGNFQNSLNEVEAAAWNSFRNVCKNFLGSYKVENYRDIVNDLLLS
ncbi:hypothetical protein LAZ67_8002204 [Cordylochernes scorpioides]|uniref:Uncharacterized protein n=1 Tax=Cordylochernes scorpioides TaxID=51811 RepID=A0ABY6KSC1_9ARAC|nr:hypothetical protein LAZ67_8002204 [Cordylochernes scorpioides]